MKKKEIQAPMFSIKGRSESSTVMGLRKENAALKAQAEGMNELKAENEKLRAQLNMRPDASNATAALQKDVEALQATNRSLDARIQQLQVRQSNPPTHPPLKHNFLSRRAFLAKLSQDCLRGSKWDGTIVCTHCVRARKTPTIHVASAA